MAAQGGLSLGPNREGRAAKSGVMASLAQMERELIVERTRAGLEAARRQGRVGGRKRLMTDKKLNAAKKLLGSGTPPQEVAQTLGLSVPTLHRWLPASSRD